LVEIWQISDINKLGHFGHTLCCSCCWLDVVRKERGEREATRVYWWSFGSRC